MAVTRRRRGRGLLAVLVVLILIAIIVVVLVVVNGGTNVSYRASIVSMQPINPAEVSVSVQVTRSRHVCSSFTIPEIGSRAARSATCGVTTT